MKLKLDENLSRLSARLFREAAMDVHTVAEEDLVGADDRSILAVCREEGRCLVTLDLHFSNPLVFSPKDCPGIAVLRLPSKPTHDDLLAACRTLADGLRRMDVTGKLWTIQPGRIREYRPEE